MILELIKMNENFNFILQDGIKLSVMKMDYSEIQSIDDVDKLQINTFADTDPGDGNPISTKHFIICDTALNAVGTDGALGKSEIWKTAANWGAINACGFYPEKLCSLQMEKNCGFF